LTAPYYYNIASKEKKPSDAAENPFGGPAREVHNGGKA
jgi:hypothetical protein